MIFACLFAPWVVAGRSGGGGGARGAPGAAAPRPLGWGQVDDDESVRAVRRALDLGVTLFDTA
ncbi:hypothetical protein ACFWFK_19035, partial [Micromonospora chalcea]